MFRFLWVAFTACVNLNELNAVEILKFGQDINYPPYAFKNTTTGQLMGIGYDIAMGVNSVCTAYQIQVVQVLWKDCWDAGKIGAKLANGQLDACMTYTHTQGVRNDYCEFSGGILNVNKAAGLISALDATGKPKVSGNSDLNGKTVVDVNGWAPTADGLHFVKNWCKNSLFSRKYTLKASTNDGALKMVLNGSADAMFVYSDQAYNYQCKAGMDSTEWDCNMWKGLGSKFAYIQTGQFGYVRNGTTLAMAKLGSGVGAKINPCLWKFMQTKAYYDICVKYDKVDECYPNQFFPASATATTHVYNRKTSQQPGPCSTGYCACPAAPASPCGTVAPVTAAPASPCGTVAPVAATVTTTPAATVTTTPAATVTTTPAASPCATAAPVTAAPASPCGTVAPAAKFAIEQKSDATALIQRLADSPITSGLFGFLLVSAAVGMIVRAARSFPGSTRFTFIGRTMTNQDDSYDDLPVSDIESSQPFE